MFGIDLGNVIAYSCPLQADGYRLSVGTHEMAGQFSRQIRQRILRSVNTAGRIDSSVALGCVLQISGPAPCCNAVCLHCGPGFRLRHT